MAVANTGLTIVTDAAIYAGVGDQYNVLDSQTANLCLRIMNRMLDNWSSEQTPLYNIVDSQTPPTPSPGFTLVPGTIKYTIGAPVSGSVFLGVRPTYISEIFLTDTNNVSYYQDMISADQYARLIYKVAPGRPDRVYANYNETTVDLYFYPQPAYTDNAHVMYLNPLLNFTLNQVVTLPPGYEEALVLNGGVRIARYFNLPVEPDKKQEARWAKGIVAAANENVYMLQSPIPTQKRRFFNILTGGTI